MMYAWNWRFGGRLPLKGIVSTVRCPRRLVRHLSRKTDVSSLYVSGEIAQNTSPITLDLNLESSFSNVDKLKQNLRARSLNIDVDRLKLKYDRLIQLRSEENVIQCEREEVARQMREVINVKPADDEKEVLLRQKGKNLKEVLKPITKELQSVEEEVMLTVLCLPNHLHDATPMLGNVQVRKSGESFASLTSDSSVNLDIVFRMTSPHGCYLIGDLAVLEQAISSYFTKRLEDNAYVPVVAPDIFRALVVEGCDYDVHDTAELFRLESKSGQLSASSGKALEYNKLEHSYYLTGASPMSMAAFFTRTIVNVDSLPLKFFCSGRNYFPTPAVDCLSSVSQSTQLSSFLVGRDPAQCYDKMDELITTLWSLYEQLDLPIQLVRIGSANLRASEALRHDIQCYLPTRNEFVTVASLSYIGDYISRRLMMRCKGQNDQEERYLHVALGCIVNVHRLIATIIENKRVAVDGGVKIPDVLLDHWIGVKPPSGVIR